LIETQDLDRKGISKPAREYYLSSDGRFTEEKGGIFSEYLPALFLLMIWSLSLFVFLGVFLLLAGVGLIDPDSDSSNMLLQLFSSLAPIVVLISPPVLSRFNLSRHSIGLEEKADFSLVGRSYLVLTLISVLLSLVLYLIMQLLYHFTESKREEVTPYPSIGFDDPGFLILWVLVAVVVGPIYEEILARGYLIPLLEKRGCSPTIAILASSAIFSGLHLQADLMAMVADGTGLGAIDFPISHAITTFMIGLVLGLVYYASGRSLKTVIALHALNNAVATLILASADLGLEIQGTIVLIYLVIALGGGGYFAFTSRQIFSRELRFAKNDLRGFENATINYLFGIYLVSLIPIMLFYLGGPLFYLGWIVVGFLLLVVFLKFTRSQSPPSVNIID